MAMASAMSAIMVRSRMMTPAFVSRSMRRHRWHHMLRPFRTCCIMERFSFPLHAKHLADVPAGYTAGVTGTRTWLYYQGTPSLVGVQR